MNTLVVVSLAALVGLGLMLILQGIRGNAVLPRRSVSRQVSWPALGIALLAGSGMYMATGWPVGAAIAVVAVGWLPKLASNKRASDRARKRSEAVAIFTEQVRDNMYSVSGVTDALIDAASEPPEALADELTTFVRRAGGDNTVGALQQLGRDIDDPFADLVIVVLTTAVSHPTDQTAPTISRLAETIRQNQKWNLRVETARSRVRTSQKMIISTFVLFVVYLYLVSPGLLAAYDSFVGQVWLLVVAAIFAAGVALFSQFSKVASPARLQARERVEGVATS